MTIRARAAERGPRFDGMAGLGTTARDLPFAAGATVTLQTRGADDGLPLARALDPRSGQIIALAPASVSGRRFEGMYRAIGNEFAP